MVVAILVLAAQLASLAPQAQRPLAPSEPLVAPLTLAAAVSTAKTSSPRRRGAAMVAEGARDAARVSGRLQNPLFELRTENWTSGGSATPGVDVFAVFTQPIELGGKRAIRRQLAVTESHVADTALETLERTIALETVRAYVRALKARALLETLAANREGLATLVTMVDRQVTEGYSPEADLLKFKTEAARVDGEIVRARLDLERSLTALTVIVGATEPIVASQLIEPSPLDPPEATNELIAARVATHPDAVAATRTLERARSMTAYERARRSPEPLVTAGYKRTAGFDTAVLGMSVMIPLFDRNAAAVARAAGAERGAAADREAVVHQLTHDATSLLRAAQAITERARMAPGDLLEPAEDVRHAARAAFREGAADVLKLIDAERVYADVQRAAIELRLDALLMTLEARFAVGEEAMP
jgi:outer membrane protein, heavy metal efflux system